MARLTTIGCQDLSTDEQLALASAISDVFQGRVVALTRGKDIVIDTLLGTPPEPEEVEAIVRRFIGKRHYSAHYSVERKGDFFTVHSPDPIAGAQGRRSAQPLRT